VACPPRHEPCAISAECESDNGKVWHATLVAMRRGSGLAPDFWPQVRPPEVEPPGRPRTPAGCPLAKRGATRSRGWHTAWFRGSARAPSRGRASAH